MRNSIALILACILQPSWAVNEGTKPVTKVVNLLKDMITQMEKEAEEDEETYEAMGCWCETNDKLKTKSIADSEQAISDLTVAIEGFTATSARLNQEIPAVEGEVAKNEEALDKATAMRKKELAEFNAEEKETIQTVASLKSAVVALSKHHEALLEELDAPETYVLDRHPGAHSLLQKDATTMRMSQAQMWSNLKLHLHKNEDFLKQSFPRHQRKAMMAFVQEAQHSHAPASGEIFGMLKQMKESFETNLANSKKEETQAQSDYESLKATKTEQITAATEMIGTKTQELAA